MGQGKCNDYGEDDVAGQLKRLPLSDIEKIKKNKGDIKPVMQD